MLLSGPNVHTSMCVSLEHLNTQVSFILNLSTYSVFQSILLTIFCVAILQVCSYQLHSSFVITNYCISVSSGMQLVADLKGSHSHKWMPVDLQHTLDFNNY